MRPVTIPGLAVVMLTLASLPAHADDIPPGFDLLRTVSMTQDFYYSEWLAAGFFDPGSDVFSGSVTFRGDPIPSVPPAYGCGALSLGLTDMIIWRLATAELPSVGSVDEIPIQVMALNLVSVAPITVTYNGGNDAELWDVRMTVSEYAFGSGTLTIAHSQANGGTFTARIFLPPRFVFTRQADGAVRVRDFGILGTVVNDYMATGGVWAHDPGAAACLSCGDTNFFPGVSPSGEIVVWQLNDPPSATHSLTAACPTSPLATESTTWGAVKARYR